MERKTFFVVAVLLALGLSVGMIWDTQAQQQTKPEGTARITCGAIEGSCAILDPILGSNNLKFFTRAMFDYLVGINDQTGAYDPEKGLAQKWEVSPDRLTWTFWIRGGVKFHNGDDLTAEDVKFSLERFMSKRSVATYSDFLRSSIEGIDVPAPNKILIRLKKPPVSFLDLYLSPHMSTEGQVMPKKYILEKGEDYFAKFPIGSGPYRFDKQVIGSYLRFKAVDYKHWRVGVPRYEYLQFDLIPEETTRLAMIKTGEADIAAVGRGRLKEAAGLNVVQGDASNMFLIFPQSWEQWNPLRDLKVRKALALSINRQEILETLFGGIGRLTGTMIACKGSLDWLDLPPFPYDPAQAKKLLAEAGYPKGFNLDVYSFIMEGIPESHMVMEAVAGYFKAIGINAQIIKSEYSGFRSKFVSRKFTVPTVAFARQNERKMTFSAIRWYMHQKLGLGATVDDRHLDTLLEEAGRADTEKSYIDITQKVHKYIYDQAYAPPLVEPYQTYITSNKVKGWKAGAAEHDYNLDFFAVRSR